MVELAWLIPLLPLVAAVVIAFLGKRLPGQGDRTGIAALSMAFALSVGVLVGVMTGGTAAGSVTWAIHGDSALRMGWAVGGIGAVLLVVVTLVSVPVPG